MVHKIDFDGVLVSVTSSVPRWKNPDWPAGEFANSITLRKVEADIKELEFMREFGFVHDDKLEILKKHRTAILDTIRGRMSWDAEEAAGESGKCE